MVNMNICFTIDKSCLKKILLFTVGLEPLKEFSENKNPPPNDKLPSTETEASIPMEIDLETTPIDIQSATNDTSTVPQVDFDSELCEFLESDTSSLAVAAVDDVRIKYSVFRTNVIN